MGCLYSVCLGKKKNAVDGGGSDGDAAAAAEPAVKVTPGLETVVIEDAKEGKREEDNDGATVDLKQQTGLQNENAVIAETSAESKSNGHINIVVTNPASANHTPGSLVHLIRRQEEVDSSADEEDQVAPLPSPRSPRPKLQRMATSEISVEGFEDDAGGGGGGGEADDSSSHSSVEAIMAGAAGGSGAGKTDSMRAEGGSRNSGAIFVASKTVVSVSAMQNNSISLDDSVTSDGCTDFAKQKIEIAPCSSVETQDDESEDDTKLTVPREVVGSFDDEMEPISEEPEEEEKAGREENQEKRKQSTSSSSDSAPPSAAADPARRKSVAESVHELQVQLFDELEQRLGGSDDEDTAAGGKEASTTKGSSSSSAEDPKQLTVNVADNDAVRRSSVHMLVNGNEE